MTSAWSLRDRLRPGQAAALLGIPTRSVRSLREDGVIAGERTNGGHWTYDRAEIEELIARRTVNGADQYLGNGTEMSRPVRGDSGFHLTRTPPDTTVARLRDRIRKYASLLTTLDRRFSPDQPIGALCEDCGQDPYYWRWETWTSDECFRLAMRRVEARLSRVSELSELRQIVNQTVRDYIWDKLDEQGGFTVYVQIDASIPQKVLDQ